MSQTHHLHVDGGRLIKRYVSWSRGEHRREWAVLHRVHARRPDLVPEPLEADLDADPPAVTMGLLPGTPLTDDLDAGQQAAFARSLRRLWSVPCADLPARRDHPAELHALMTRRLAGLDLPGPAGEAAHAARSFLAGLRLAPAGTTVLGHADPNLANYLWDGQRIRIVDFEDAGRSDPEFELADLVEHLAARRADWTAFLTTFDLDGDRLLDARRLYAVFWLHMLRPGGPAEHRNPPGTLEQQAERLLNLL
ncbi:aminoglycoside phosphotransferase family protein [Dactylosporangium sp. NPDC006015]|uniref:phosphotransferase family protein n=1 Tax=Dactylosporangium sp. NPDC006015 TaxID=3154576 RepID=UPI0033A1052A